MRRVIKHLAQSEQNGNLVITVVTANDEIFTIMNPFSGDNFWKKIPELTDKNEVKR